MSHDPSKYPSNSIQWEQRAVCNNHLKGHFCPSASSLQILWLNPSSPQSPTLTNADFHLQLFPDLADGSEVSCVEVVLGYWFWSNFPQLILNCVANSHSKHPKACEQWEPVSGQPRSILLLWYQPPVSLYILAHLLDSQSPHSSADVNWEINPFTFYCYRFISTRSTRVPKYFLQAKTY